jgi:hypothetical protein
MYVDGQTDKTVKYDIWLSLKILITGALEHLTKEIPILIARSKCFFLPYRDSVQSTFFEYNKSAVLVI